MASPGPAGSAVLAIDQGTTNSKALLVGSDGEVLATGSAPVGLSTPRTGWVEQDAEGLWASVVAAVGACVDRAPGVQVTGVALSSQRESVVGWRAGTGRPIGPVIGWQDQRTAAWCATLGTDVETLVREQTGLRVDAMFSAPKMRWLLDHLSADAPVSDIRVGTVDSWLLWRLTGGGVHRTEAGNASRTLLYDITTLDWGPALLEAFGVPRSALPEAVASDHGFGSTAGLPGVPDGTPVLAVLADSHAALYGHGCTEPGMAKATYGTGSSVMTPAASLPSAVSGVPTTLAWVVGDHPTYALEGNILSSGATLTWAAGLVAGGSVSELVALAATVPDAGGLTLVPAFTGLGAPHWDREAQALVVGLTAGTTGAHLARAAVDAVGHQICDVVDVVEASSGPLTVFRADGGATASSLVVQTQADLLGRAVDVSPVAEVSALGVAKLAWSRLGAGDDWPTATPGRRVEPTIDATERVRRRRRWAGEVARSRFSPEPDATAVGR